MSDIEWLRDATGTIVQALGVELNRLEDENARLTVENDRLRLKIAQWEAFRHDDVPPHTHPNGEQA